MPVENPRITVARREGTIRVVVGPIRDTQAWIAGLFIAATVTVAVVTGVSAVQRAAQGSRVSLSGLIIVSIFAAMLALLSLDVLWRLFGHEEIVADPTETTVALRLLAFRRKNSFHTSEIRNVDWSERQMMWLRGTRRSLVVYLAGRRIELRSQLSLPEANHLSREIWPMIRELQRTAKGGGYRGSSPPTPAP